ncbi:glycosyl hydrolase [Gaetbulibacter aquiaggeris]|uniref:Glycosyl hydrolase n=1 Tax=Gaetbulibacter aquiaggeris TaxID=1735373 RepID=A0ABW7MPS7_9FLAO
MKKYLSILIFSLLIVSCEKNVIGDFEQSAYFGADQELPADLSKKGVAYTNRGKNWSHKTSALKAHWMYSWGRVLAEEVPENVEFVPMFWGKGSVTDENIAATKQLVADGKVKYVLGFNEPDGAEQANMSVDEAIALWPKLEELGVPLGSPATVGPTNAWMTEFMTRADELGLRIDFVTVHSYGGANALSFINKLKETHEAYNRPIWVTEFAVADWNATTPENNRYTNAEVIRFMQEATQAMNSIEWVIRYSWFDGQNAPLATSGLFDAEGNITALGEVYAAINANEAIGPGQDTDYVPPVDLDEIMVNGGFEAGIAPWGGFKNGAVGTATTEPLTGNFSGRIDNGDGALNQVVPVEEGKTYIFKYNSKWRDAVTNGFTPVIRNNSGNAVLFTLNSVPLTTSWEETVFEFTVPAGVSELKIVFYKGQGFPPIFLDDVSLKLK